MNDRVLQMSPQMSFRVDVSSQRNNDHALRALMCAVACSAVLTACKTISSATGAAGEAVANVLLPVSQENQMGVQLVKEVEKESKIHADKDVQDYVANLGKNIAAQAHDVPAGIKFTFKVIDDPKTVNAFALPGGHIYVYSGLMKLADDEAELASVIGHEIAHVTQRHVAER